MIRTLGAALSMAIATLVAAPRAAPARFHVAPRGSDLNPGTRRSPFATLDRALDAARQAGPAGMVFLLPLRAPPS